MKNDMNFQLFLANKPSLFFLGIGGVSMSALAMTAKSLGCKVAGYDAAHSETTEKLEEVGIPVYDAFSKEHYIGVDMIVYTGAIRDNDISLSYPREIGIPEMTRAEFLGLLMKQSPNPVGVAGTHGKSTTTGMLSSIFMAENSDPTIMAGAVLPELDSTYRIGEGPDFLFEACEYQNSFLDFFPRLALILNVEHDHADFFPTLEDVIASFVRFADKAAHGFAVINADNEGACQVAEQTKAPVFRFSKKGNADLWCENLKETKGFYSFDLMNKNGFVTSVSLSVPGEHNVSNALAAASAALLSGVSPEGIGKGLAAFRGVKRRFEYRGDCGKMKVFDDYAHHPDEINATLTSAKKLGYDSITVVFQSHTYTRTKTYWDNFISALSLADKVIFADIYAAREEPICGITGKALAQASQNGIYVGDFDAIADYLKKHNEESGLLLIMGAGTIVNLTDKVLTQANE